MTKLLRVVAPSWVASANVHYAHGRSHWGKAAPLLKRIIGRMTVLEFMQYLDGQAKRVGWSYSWVD